jgi:uncharacterized protein
VINNSFKIAADHDVDPNLVYVIAAYHDVGLAFGRDGHETASRTLMLEDEKLRQWFTDEQIVTMGDAVQDHRASIEHEPRTIYGRIVAEADRDIRYLTILKRCVLFELARNPTHSYQDHVGIIVKHLHEKYCEGGYLKLWLRTEDNARNLQELRDKVASGEALEDVKKIMDECTARDS